MKYSLYTAFSACLALLVGCADGSSSPVDDTQIPMDGAAADVAQHDGPPADVSPDVATLDGANADAVADDADGSESEDSTGDEGGSATDTDAVSGPFTLTVVGGYGGGSYPAGIPVHVFGAVDPHQAVVTGWEVTGAPTTVTAEWHQIIEMPAGDLTLTPTVQDVPMELKTIQVEGVQSSKRVIYAVPPSPKGVVFVHHGTGGSADVIYGASMQTLARVAFLRGYAVVATDAEEVTTGDPGPDGKPRWNVNPDLASNIDLQNLSLISDVLAAQTAVPSDAPRFAIGMSNGGSFSVTVGLALPFAAVTSFCATGTVVAYTTTTTPTQWLMCGQDTNESVSGKKDQWMDGTDSLAARGIATDYVELQPSPVFSGRFARLPGVDATGSAEAVNELYANDALDGDGFLTVVPATLRSQILAAPGQWPVLTSLVAELGPVYSEIKHAWADHQMHDDFAARTLDFLEAHAD